MAEPVTTKSMLEEVYQADTSLRRTAAETTARTAIADSVLGEAGTAGIEAAENDTQESKRALTSGTKREGSVAQEAEKEEADSEMLDEARSSTCCPTASGRTGAAASSSADASAARTTEVVALLDSSTVVSVSKVVVVVVGSDS